MTEERAKKVLQEQIDKYGQEYDAEGIEALKMAIKALEQQPSDSNIADPCDGCRYELNSTNGNPCYSCGKYKLTEQQPCEDCVSRETLKERFRWLEKATKYGNKDAEQQHFSYSTMMMYEIKDEIDNVIDSLPSVKPQRPSGEAEIWERIKEYVMSDSFMDDYPEDVIAEIWMMRKELEDLKND